MWKTLVLIFLSSSALAHPVTYKGGVAMFSMHRPDSTQLQANYTLNRHFAIAASHIRKNFHHDAAEVSLLHANILAYRRNSAQSQSNIYLSVGGGLNAQTEANGFAAIQLDHETDHFYSAFSGQTFGSLAQFQTPSDLPFSLRGRLGVLPFAPNVDGLQIWAVVQTTWEPHMHQPVEITPMLRFFYQNVLWETGVSIDGTPWFQMMVHL